MTVYKGNTKLDYETNATSAVGLGTIDIFQSFIICSEHDGKNDYTKLTFGKIRAGN